MSKIVSSPLVDSKELIGLTILLGAYGIVLAFDMPPEALQFVNIIGPSCLALVLAWGCWRQLYHNQFSLWQPLFWFRLGCIAYYGVGAIAPYAANDATVEYMKSFYLFSEVEVFKVGLINLFCVLTVLFSARIFALHHTSADRRINASPSASSSNTFRFVAFFLIAGGIARYGALGLTEPPALLVALARSYVVGLFLLVLVGLRGNRVALSLALVLIPIDLMMGLLTFAKVEVLLTLIFTFLGVLHHKLNLPRIIMGAGVVLFVFSQLDPVIHFGRDEIWRRHKSITAPLDERLEILNLYLNGAAETGAASEVQMPLNRLSYVNAAAMAVTWYDIGQTGDSLKNALVVVVPRLLWPDKPDVTAVGAEFYTAATGQVGATFSPGLFAEAYWNLGWSGIPILMTPLGIVLGFLSRYSLNVMRVEKWLCLPVVLIGVQIGTRVDGWYVADVIGASCIAFVYVIAFSAIENVLNSKWRH